MQAKWPCNKFHAITFASTCATYPCTGTRFVMVIALEQRDTGKCCWWKQKKSIHSRARATETNINLARLPIKFRNDQTKAPNWCECREMWIARARSALSIHCIYHQMQFLSLPPKLDTKWIQFFDGLAEFPHFKRFWTEFTSATHIKCVCVVASQRWHFPWTAIKHCELL